MRISGVLLMLFASVAAAYNDDLPILENVVDIKLEVTCQRPYIAIVHFYNRSAEPIRLSRAYVDPAGYWNDYDVTISLGKDIAKRKMINSLHYRSRVLEDISVVLPAGGVLKSIMNLEQRYVIPESGFKTVRYSALWYGVILADGSMRHVRVESDAFIFDDHCIREQLQ